MSKGWISVFPDENAKYVLYHAVSTYQLLCMMVHKLQFNPNVRAVLILPDFIVDKFPDYLKLVELNIFDEVYLFEYLKIPHEQSTLNVNIESTYDRVLSYKIEDFSEVYVGGVHFYFSLYLINHNVKFDAFEDAAGMLSKPDEMYNTLNKKFPFHAKIAYENGLFDMSNKLIQKIYCLMSAQTAKILDKKCCDFNIVKLLTHMRLQDRERVIDFFTGKRYEGNKRGVILLTQHFSNLGIMTAQEQVKLYIDLKEKYLSNKNVIVKPHPDDKLDYSVLFPDANVINEIFPSELLPFMFKKRPRTVITVSSTAVAGLNRWFRVVVCSNNVKGNN